MKEKYYVTTAIDYVNAAPHIGHAYQKIVADVLARWNTLHGKDVFFLTGTDEHGKKVETSAKAAGKEPKEFVDEIVPQFIEAWNALNIKSNRFIRTTDEDHKELVNKFIKICDKNGDIYKGEYEGNYCVGCESYITDKELVDGKCPYHPGKKIEKIKEESYFFKLSKYQDFLLDLYKNNPEFVQPESRRNEIINRVKDGLKDLSISRTSFNWGIPFPLEPETHITYVWFDALLNYLTGAGKNQEYWEDDTKIVHLLGKDNTWFHTVYWPAMLKSAGYRLPDVTYNHGFISFNGHKISKSLGNAISPKILAEKYGADTVRYFCLRHFPFASGEDGDFNENALIDRHNNELLNKLGNLVSRTASLIEKNGIEKCENSLKINYEKIKDLIDKYEFDKALNEIFAYIDKCNEYVQTKKPWETKDQKVLYELADAIKNATILLFPFMPSTCEKIAEQFDFEISINSLNTPLKENSKIKKGDYIFTRIDAFVCSQESDEEQQGKLKSTNIASKDKINKEPKIKEVMENVATLAFEDWMKVDLRVAEIKEVEDIEGADKLYKITLDIGEERTVCAGLKKYYSKEELKGMKVIIIANLAPRKMRGIESNGMLLAAATDDDSKVVLIGPTKDIDNGSKVF